MSHPFICLTATNLEKRFGSRRLLRQLSLELRGGESLAITGPNGSGKSTLLKILGGLLAPSRGRVDLKVGDEEIERIDHALQVGIVAPYVNLYLPLTARENLLFLARLRGLAERHERVRVLLGEVGLAARADDQVSTFSSGMMQRLRIAAARLPDPPLLLLDEPSVTLDDSGLALVERAIDAQMKSGGITVVATNVATEAARCQRHLNLDDVA